MKKGFTLVELLAVIVILAIIALIAVPIIMNIVESSRKSSATSSAYGYIDGVKIMYAKEMLSGSDFTLEGTFNVDEEGKLEGHKVEIEGTKAKGGYLTYSNGKITEGCLTIGDYKVTIENDEVKTTEKGKCNDDISTTDDYIQNNLVLHYDAINNTGSGHSNDTTIWKDLSGNNNDGTLQGFSFDINNGWTSNSLKINGKNFVTASNAELTNFTSSDFTIEVVFKNIGTYIDYYPVLVSNGSYTKNGYYSQLRKNGGISFHTNQPENTQYLSTSQNKIISNKNTSVTFVRKGENMKIYVNGILDAQINNIIDPASSTKPYTINANQNWNGELMNTRVYNRALSEQEITDNFNLDKIRYNIK